MSTKIVNLLKRLGLKEEITPQTRSAEKIHRVLVVVSGISSLGSLMGGIILYLIGTIELGALLFFAIFLVPGILNTFLLLTKYWYFSGYIMLIFNILLILPTSIEFGFGAGVFSIIVVNTLAAVVLFRKKWFFIFSAFLTLIISILAAVITYSMNIFDTYYFIGLFATMVLFLPAFYIIVSVIMGYLTKLQNDLENKNTALEEQLILTTDLNSELTKRNNLLHLEKVKQEDLFLAMSHEIKTPLTTVYGCLEQLFLVTEEKNKPLLVQTDEAMKKLIKVSESVIDFSRASSKSLDTTISKFDLITLLREVIDNHKQLAETKNLNLRLDAEKDESLFITSDRDKLLLIINNIVSNSIKYTNQGYVYLYANVVIETQKHPQASIVVQDSGIGIPKNKMFDVFDTFYQVDRNKEGSGLGLSIVKKYLEVISGRFRIKSRLGKGTWLEIIIPLELDQKKLNKDTQEPLEKNLGVIVEDNATNASLIKQQLKSFGQNIKVFNDAQSFLKSNSIKKASYILLDINLPDAVGYELIDDIRLLNKKCKIVAISAYPESIIKAKTISMGFDAYLSKPFSVQKLKETISSFTNSEAENNINSTS